MCRQIFLIGLATMILLLGFSSGCKLAERSDSEGSSDALIDTGGAYLPRKCEEMLDFKEDITNYTALVGKTYKYDKCLRKIHVGLSGETTKNRALFFQPGMSGGGGNFEATTAFMDRNRISCKKKNGNFVLTFPKHRDDDESEYTEIEMKCHDNTKYIEAWIGVNVDNKRELSVLLKVQPKDDYALIEWHAFDTNSTGQIIKHEKLRQLQQLQDGDESRVIPGTNKVTSENEVMKR